MPSDDRPGLLILEAAIPSWMAFFEAARARGLEIYSTCAEESVAERGGYCAEVIRHTPNYFHNLDEIVKAVASLAGRRRIDGIVSPYEATTPVLAHAAAALDLPGPRVETCGALCNKQAMRAEFEKAGLPSPVSHPVASLDEARGAAEQIGYPVVIKPTAGAGSIGVTRVDNSDGLAGAFALVEQACETVHAPPEFLVEEFLRGPQLSVESITFKGETVWQGTTFVPHPMDGPHFPVHELITPSPLPPRTLEGLYALNERVNGVMGVHGVTHTEYRLTPQGPRLIELNPRPAGQNIPEMYQQVYGVDLVGAAIDCARGKRPEIEPPAGGGLGRLFAGYRCLEAPAGNYTISGTEAAAKVPGITDIRIEDRWPATSPPHDMQMPKGYVFGKGPDYDALRVALRQAHDTIEFGVSSDNPSPSRSAPAVRGSRPNPSPRDAARRRPKGGLTGQR